MVWLIFRHFSRILPWARFGITRYLVKYSVRYRINRRMNVLKKVVSVMQAFSAGYSFKKIFLIKFKPSFHPRVHFFFLRKQVHAREPPHLLTITYLESAGSRQLLPRRYIR